MGLGPLKFLKKISSTKHEKCKQINRGHWPWFRVFLVQSLQLQGNLIFARKNDTLLIYFSDTRR